MFSIVSFSALYPDVPVIEKFVNFFVAGSCGGAQKRGENKLFLRTTRKSIVLDVSPYVMSSDLYGFSCYPMNLVNE